jgi:aspartyl-tRNA(Asn)/glutamyl-tRNA(Gln) amidotransferase subunit A
MSVLERAALIDKHVNAFCHLDPEAAIAQARLSEDRWRRNEQKSALDGVPVSIKDNIGTAGMPTRLGSRAITEEQSSLPDDPSVARLRHAGAIIFGKTCCPDFSHKLVTDSPLTGLSRNPWDLDRTPGGSSGGAAAAVAALAGPLALCTDAGGSVRIPAAFTGTFGFKPSFGRVPQKLGGISGPLGHVGPLTRSVADAAEMMNVISLPDSADWYALPYEQRDYRKNLDSLPKGLRIAYSKSLGLGNDMVAPDVEEQVRKAVLRIAELIPAVEDIDPPAIARCREIHGIMWSSLAARLAASLGERRALLAPTLESLARRGEDLPREAFVSAVYDRGEVGSHVNAFFERFDILLCPVYVETAPSFSDIEAGRPVTPVFTNWCNVVGNPAASIPCGQDRRGMPVGLQVVGRQYADAQVLAVCRAIENMSEPHNWPKVA